MEATFMEATKKAVDDISLAVKNKSIWMSLGWNDIQGRYNRSKLGVLWAGLSLFIFVGALGPIYATLMGISLREYIIHLSLGFIVWNYVSSIILESGGEFTRSTNYLVSFRLSYFTLLFRVVWRNLIVLMYQMIVFILFAVVLQHPLGMFGLFAPLALILITLNALWMGLIMSVLATRFRDLSELMNNILRLVFFITPVIWVPSLAVDLALVANLNPFYHLLELFREPLLMNSINQLSISVSLGMALVGWPIAFFLFARCRSKIAFWL
jgi:ABC-type polysaccharide/polyol phosphate export permease